MNHVFDLKLSACLLNESGNRGIVDMADSWKQMVLDLKVQPTGQPGNKSAPSGKIHSCFDLMDCPIVLNPSRPTIGYREFRVLDAVR